jgi:hypothetical protein
MKYNNMFVNIHIVYDKTYSIFVCFYFSYISFNISSMHLYGTHKAS